MEIQINNDINEKFGSFEIVDWLKILKINTSITTQIPKHVKSLLCFHNKLFLCSLNLSNVSWIINMPTM